MKMLSSIKRYALLFTPLLIFIISCKQVAEKNISLPKLDVTAADAKKHAPAKKEEVAAKEKGSPNSKAGGSKWEANSSASKVGFSVKGPFGTVNGTLAGLVSTIVFDKNNLAASSIRASVDTRSISTGIKLRNSDLQKAKYLDAEKFPAISFQSDKIEKTGNGYKAIGTLKIKGVSKHEEIPFTFTENGNTGVFKGNFTIQRQDFGVGTAGGSIGNDVSVNLLVTATKAGGK